MSSLFTTLVHPPNTKSVSIFYVEEKVGLSQVVSDEMNKRNLGLRETAKIIGTSHPTLMRALAGETITFEFGLQLAPFLGMKPERVFRLAGLLPPVPERTEAHEQVLHLWDQLSEADKTTILRMMAVMIE